MGVMLSIVRENVPIASPFEVKSAFSNGSVDNNVYTAMLIGNYVGKGNTVRKPLRSIYGLKQSPRAWSQNLRKGLASYGFHLLLNTKSVFTESIHGSLAFHMIYIDDIHKFAKTTKEMSGVEKFPAKTYSMQDLGNAEYLLGIKPKRAKEK